MASVIERLRELRSRATAPNGKWAFDFDSANVVFDGRGIESEGDRLGCFIAAPKYRTDGGYIAAAHNALPALLALADAVEVMMDPSRPLDKAEEDGAAVEKALAELKKEAQ